MKILTFFIFLRIRLKSAVNTYSNHDFNLVCSEIDWLFRSRIIKLSYYNMMSLKRFCIYFGGKPLPINRSDDGFVFKIVIQACIWSTQIDFEWQTLKSIVMGWPKKSVAKANPSNVRRRVCSTSIYTILYRYDS